jgi:hypothetical protein
MLALCAAAGAAWAEPPASPAPPPGAVAARLIVGELTRVDLGRRSVSVKTESRDAGRTEGREARELETATGPDTRFVSRGRVVRLEDLRPGDRVVLLVSDEGGRRRARVVKVVGRVALPAPSPTPAAPGPPAAPGSSG